MSVLIKILLITILFFPGSVCFAQGKVIDSLKQILPLLRDTARVDCLNELSWCYERGNNDTASFYADLAYRESIGMNYKHGTAMALFRKAEIQSEKDNNYPAELNYSLQAIGWYRKTPNKKGIAPAYINLGMAFYKQSYFPEALKNLDTAYQWYEKNNEGDGMILSLIMASNVNQEMGNYEKYFDLNKKSLELATKYDSYEFRDHQIANFGSFFEDVGDYKKALEYYHLAFASSKSSKESGSKSIDEILVLGHVFSLYHQFDSAKFYLSLADTSVLRTLRFYLVGMGEYYFAQGKYGQALPYYLRGLIYHRQINDRNQVMNSLIEIARIYVALEKTDSAFKYVTEGKLLVEQTHAKGKMRDAYQILSAIYENRHQPDSAFFYFKKYTLIKDSVLNDKVKGQLNVFESDQKIALLTKEKEIQEAQLQKQALLRNILIAGILIFLLLAVIIFRVILLKRRNDAHRRLLAENELQIQQLESKRQFAELEMQALRAQMNPHFIFNSLNSINRFILQNNRVQASEYLTKFSKLVRMILQNSQSSFITLENELESLGLYLEMEALRFNYHFTYNVSVPKDLDIEILKVPPLILQPYVENAIWHGLMHKEENGQLDIQVSQHDDYLCFKITDNGIGRQKASELASKSATKHKSMGLRITAQRIAMMQMANGLKSPVKIHDLVTPDGEAAGTEVIIKMPVLYD